MDNVPTKTLEKITESLISIYTDDDPWLFSSRESVCNRRRRRRALDRRDQLLTQSDESRRCTNP